jgi:5'-nucleotidase / UDP-sugar diphosphatase
MRKFSIIVVTILSFLCGFASYGRSSDTLTILHVNDFHGRILPYLDKAVDPMNQSGGAAYLAEAINNERRKNPDGTILLSAGDMFQGTPISNLNRGKPVIEFMNMIGFDAMAMGNHELDWGLEVFGNIALGARFPVLSANIVDDGGRTLNGVKPFVIIERKGFKIAVIGMTTPSVIHMVNSKFLENRKVLEPVVILPQLIKEVKAKGADVVVLLSHIGFDEDRALATAVDGIDVIVGGHSHTVVTQAVNVGNTLVAQAGSNGINLGVIRVALERKNGNVVVVDKNGILRKITAREGAAQDRAIADMVNGYNDKIKQRFQEVVGETTIDLMRRGEEGESNIGNAITDAMREISGADIAFHNPGGIRADILKGKITMEQVYTVLPFDNVVVTMDLKGADIFSLFEAGSGVGRGALQVSGARVAYDGSKPVGQKVALALVNGKPIEKSKVYRVATNDFLSVGGDKFLAFKNGENVTQGEELREVFLKYLKGHSPLNAGIEGRITTRNQ